MGRERERGRPVLGPLRTVFVVFTGLAAAAALSLTLAPTRTDEYFAWPIQPPFTAALLGAAYSGALVLFALSLRETTWTRVRLAVTAPFTLSTALLVTTLLHRDRFAFDDGGLPAVIAWFWLVVYVVVPPLLVLAAVRQQRAPGADPPVLSPLPAALRTALGVLGGVAVVGGAVLFAVPEDLARHWPWAISALTGRAIASWIIGLGVAALHGAVEGDLRSLRAGSPALAVLGLVGLLAVVRFHDNLDGGVGSVLLVVVLALLSAVGVVATLLERRRA